MGENGQRRGAPGWWATSAQAFGRTMRNVNMRRAQLASAAAWTSEAAFLTVLAVYAFEQGGAKAVGIVGFARLLPAALAMPFAATLADRMPRERLLVASGLTRALALGLMAAAVAAGWPPAVVYLAAVAATIGFTPFRPAHSALLPSLCHASADLTAANAVRSLLDGASALAGPVLAALLLDLTSLEVGFAATGACALYSAYAIARLRFEAPPLPPVQRRRVLAETAEGLAELARARDQRLLVALGACQVVARGAMTVFAAVLALDVLDMGESGVGVLWAIFGAGALAGGAGAFTLVGSRRLGLFFGSGIAIWGAPLVVIGLLPSTPVAVGMLLVVGVGNAIIDVTIFTLLQRLTPDRVLGRMLGVAEMVWTVAMATGALLAPALISLLGAEGAIVAIGAMLPLAVAAGLAGLRRIDGRVTVREREIDLLRGVPMLRPLPVPSLEYLATRAEPVRFLAGAQVFREGDPGDRFYVIAAGEVEVTTAGKVVCTFGPGDWFGEIALLRHVPRTATVQALSDLDLRALDSDAFVPSVSGYRAAAAEAEAVVGARTATS